MGKQGEEMEDSEECNILEVTSLHNEIMDSKPSRTHLYQSVIVLNMLYLICGTAFAWSSPVLPKLHLSDAEGSSVASMLSLGSVLGPFISGAVLDKIGRKGTVALSMGLMTGSYLLLTLASSITHLSIARFMAGIMSGITYSAVPMYIAEISEDSVRGFLNTLSQISCSLGSLLMYSIGPFVSYDVLHYIMLGISVFFFVLFPLLPNSPYSLIMKNDGSHARDTLTWLRENRSVCTVEKELQLIQNIVRQNQDEKGSIKDLFTSVGNRRALLLCTVLLFLQQVSGISIIFFYAEKIFVMTGTNLPSSTCSIVIGIIMTISSFPSPVAVKYYGYKKPLLVSASGMALGMGGLGVFFMLKHNHFEVDAISWLPLLSVVVYILFFNVGFGNIPWALTGELFPSNIKPYATALIAASCGFFAFLTTNLFPDLITLLGMDFLFMACSFFSCIAVVFISLVMQDTCGLSFAEIQEILNGRKRKDIQRNQPINATCLEN